MSTALFMLEALYVQICTMLSTPIDSNGFNVSNQCITYVMGILPFPNCVNGTYKYIATWINKHYIQQWMSCNVVSTI